MSEKFDKLKKDVLKQVEEILDMGKNSRGMEIEIHLDVGSHPNIDFSIRELLVKGETE
jgi:hypothetical protein